MAKSITVGYRNSFEDIYNAALLAVSMCGYAITATYKDTGVITFESGFSGYSWAGQKMHILIMQSQNDKINVSIAGVRKSHGILPQIYDCGESIKIGSKIHAQIDAIILRMQRESRDDESNQTK